MRNYEEEVKKRVSFIQQVLSKSGAKGIVYGNSGGKDSTLVGILCKKACEHTIGIMMPCGSRRNYEEDIIDAQQIASLYSIETRTIDLAPCQRALQTATIPHTRITETARQNLAPRLRMASLYFVAASEHCLVAGCGNSSELYLGYFTKWGDGAYDLNPIADLCVQEVYEFLHYLQVPASILTKAPSANLYDGQSDEQELGVTYQTVDRYLQGKSIPQVEEALILQYHQQTEHKRQQPLCYGETYEG